MGWEQPFQQVDCVTLTLTPPGENVQTLFRGERVASISCCFGLFFFKLSLEFWNLGRRRRRKNKMESLELVDLQRAVNPKFVHFSWPF